MLRKPFRAVTNFHVQFRLLHNAAPRQCRGCSSALDKGQEVLHTYTIAGPGKGLELYFCDECQFEIAAMFTSRYDNLDEFGNEIIIRKMGK